MEFGEALATGYVEHEDKWGKLKTGDVFAVALNDVVIVVKATEEAVNDGKRDNQKVSVMMCQSIKINANLMMEGQKFTQDESEERYMPYKQYLKTNHWREFRAYVLKELGEVCTDCGATDVRFDVHHLTYENLWHEELEDVVVLCHSCHWDRHPEKQRLKCKHEHLAEAVSGKGSGSLGFFWACTDCMELVGSREPTEKEKIMNEKEIAKHKIWQEKEDAKRAVKDAKKKERDALRKEKEKLNPKKKKKRKTYKKRVPKMAEFPL
jgi:hypothetical protein